MDSPLLTKAISTAFTVAVTQGQGLSESLGAGSGLGSFQTHRRRIHELSKNESGKFPPNVKQLHG
jgi:hypothetical protein